MAGTGRPVLSRSGASIPKSLLRLWRGRSTERGSLGTRPAADPLLAAGRQLRQRREERGLSLRQLAQSTRISTVVLEALERGWRDRLPEAAYLRTMVPLLEAQLDLEPGTLASAIPDDRSDRRKASPILRRGEVGLDAIELVDSWQGSLLFAALSLGLIYGLNLAQQQLAAQGRLALRPILPLPIQEQSRPPNPDAGLLQAYPELRPLELAARGQALARLASDASPPQASRQGMLELQLSQRSRISLSSEAGLRTDLEAASGLLSLPLAAPFTLQLDPAPGAGSQVLWNGSPLAPQPGQAGQFEVEAPAAARPQARTSSP